MGPSLLSDIFEKRECGNNNRVLRSNNDFFLPQVNTVHYGHDSLRYLGCKIWELIPSEIKTSTDVKKFKIKIKSWVPSGCTCRLCKTYLYRIEYISFYGTILHIIINLI